MKLGKRDTYSSLGSVGIPTLLVGIIMAHGSSGGAAHRRDWTRKRLDVNGGEDQPGLVRGEAQQGPSVPKPRTCPYPSRSSSGCPSNLTTAPRQDGSVYHSKVHAFGGTSLVSFRCRSLNGSWCLSAEHWFVLVTSITPWLHYYATERLCTTASCHHTIHDKTNTTSDLIALSYSLLQVPCYKQSNRCLRACMRTRCNAFLDTQATSKSSCAPRGCKRCD